MLLVSPEYDYGVPGYLKNAVDWMSRPFGDPTLVGRPMAVCGASSGYHGALRAQLHWRQSWYFFKAPIFSETELADAYGGEVFDGKLPLSRAKTLDMVDGYTRHGFTSFF